MRTQVIISSTEGIRVVFEDVENPQDVADFHKQLSEALIKNAEEITKNTESLLEDLEEQDETYFLAHTTTPSGETTEYWISKDDKLFLKNLETSLKFDESVIYSCQEVKGFLPESYLITSEGETIILSELMDTVADLIHESMKED